MVPLPDQLTSPAFGLFSPPKQDPTRAVWRGSAPLLTAAGLGTAGRQVTVKKRFKLQCSYKCGFNFKPLGFVAAFLFTFTFFPQLPLNIPL